MAWYGGDRWDYYPPYVSAGEKKARGALALAKPLKKSKRAAEPVVLAHRKRQLATTFWGQAWADHLERYADLANRLPRGRAYLRNGSLLDLAIGPGRVGAYVAGSELYRVTIVITPLAKARWRRIVTRCTGRIGSLIGLLRGELSAEVLGILADARDGLFPEPRELSSACSCPAGVPASSPTRATGCSRNPASCRSTAPARTVPRCASTSRPCSTGSRCDSTRGQSSSSLCVGSPRPS